MIAPEEEIMVGVELVHMEGLQVHIVGNQVLIMAMLGVLLMIVIMMLHLHMRGAGVLAMEGKGVWSMLDTAGSNLKLSIVFDRKSLSHEDHLMACISFNFI